MAWMEYLLCSPTLFGSNSTIHNPNDFLGILLPEKIAPVKRALEWKASVWVWKAGEKMKKKKEKKVKSLNKYSALWFYLIVLYSPFLWRCEMIKSLHDKIK